MGRESGAKASVFYGITASAGSVNAAIAAWRQVGGPLRFIDLILLRRGKGTLCSSSLSSQVASTPPEVWRQILADVVSAELDRTERMVQERLFCEFHKGKVDNTSGKTSIWEAHSRVLAKCGGCLNRWERHECEAENLQGSDGLFAYFGLRLHCNDILAVRNSIQHFVLPIAIPSRLERSSTWDKTIVHASPGYEGPDPSQIVGLNFIVPANVDQRFVRLVKVFGLNVVDCDTDTFTIGADEPEVRQVATSEGSFEKKIEEEGEENQLGKGTPSSHANKVRPGWKLWLSAWYDE